MRPAPRRSTPTGLLVTPGLRRHPHALRRPGHLGPDAVAVELARRHDAGHGQLRRRLRPGRRPTKREWLIGADGGRRGHPRHRAARGHPLGVGDLPRVPRRARCRCRSRSTSAAQAPHGAIRAYVMGERGARNEPATPEDIAAMARIVAEAIEAGAVGVSTSRTILHKAVDGEPVPGTFAAEDELFALGHALGRGRPRRVRARARRHPGRGHVRARPGGRVDAPARDGDRRPVTFGFLQHDVAPDDWRAPARPRRRRDRRRRAAAPAGARSPDRACCSACRASTRSACARRWQRSRELCRSTSSSRELRKPAVARGDPRRGPTCRDARATSAWASTGSSRSATRPTTSRAPETWVAADRGTAEASIPTSCSTTCCCSATAASCCCARSSATATSPSTPCARCCCTRRPCSASATAAPTSA